MGTRQRFPQRFIKSGKSAVGGNLEAENGRYISLKRPKREGESMKTIRTHFNVGHYYRDGRGKLLKVSTSTERVLRRLREVGWVGRKTDFVLHRQTLLPRKTFPGAKRPPWGTGYRLDVEALNEVGVTVAHRPPPSVAYEDSSSQELWLAWIDEIYLRSGVKIGWEKTAERLTAFWNAHPRCEVAIVGNPRRVGAVLKQLTEVVDTQFNRQCEYHTNGVFHYIVNPDGETRLYGDFGTSKPVWNGNE